MLMLGFRATDGVVAGLDQDDPEISGDLWQFKQARKSPPHHQALRALSVLRKGLVEPRGIEPLTSAMPLQRSPS